VTRETASWVTAFAWDLQRAFILFRQIQDSPPVPAERALQAGKAGPFIRELLLGLRHHRAPLVLRMIVTEAKPAGQEWQCPSDLENSVLHQFRIGYKMHFYLNSRWSPREIAMAAL
jgi:hypothetical protein